MTNQFTGYLSPEDSEVKQKPVTDLIEELASPRREEFLPVEYDEYPTDVALIEIFYILCSDYDYNRDNSYEEYKPPRYNHKQAIEILDVLLDRIAAIRQEKGIEHIRSNYGGPREYSLNALEDAAENMNILIEHWKENYFYPRVMRVTKSIETDWWITYALSQERPIQKDEVYVSGLMERNSSVLLYDTYVPFYRLPSGVTFVPPSIALTGAYGKTEDVRFFDPQNDDGKIHLKPWNPSVDISESVYTELKELGYIA